MKHSYKILFVYRGYGADLSNSVIDFQKKSLLDCGLQVESFAFSNSGISGYLKNILLLREFLKRYDFHLIHAHYSFSGFLSSLSSNIPVVCSLMGSDLLQQKGLIKFVTKLFSKLFWKATIVKSKPMQSQLKNSYLIPNGVDFENFRPIPKADALKETGFNPGKKNIIFVAQDPHSKVKNLELAKKAIELTGNEDIELHLIKNKKFDELPFYYNSADLILLTSLSEGSPNIIKEAMACNLPIVAVDVGDIRQVLDDTDGTYICPHDAKILADRINKSIEFSGKTNGREKIKHLDNMVIAEKINAVYQNVMQK